jgi:transcriptional antiterminator RfaH
MKGKAVITKHFSDIPLWYAIHTNPRQEMRAESNLKAWNVETYLPKIKESSLNQYDGNRTWLIKPLFPRYFFARFQFSMLGSKIRFTRGVKEVVGFGECPVPIDNEIINLIQSRQDGHGYVKLEDGIAQGDEVIIKQGMFKGIRGIFERNVRNSDRILILLKTVHFQAHIVIDREDLKKV